MDCPLSGGTIREETLFSAGDEIRPISRPKHKVDCIDAKLRVKFNPGNFCRKLWWGGNSILSPPPRGLLFFSKNEKMGETLSRERREEKRGRTRMYLRSRRSKRRGGGGGGTDAQGFRGHPILLGVLTSISQTIIGSNFLANS